MRPAKHVLVLSVLLAAGLAAQGPVGFVTTVKPLCITPGAKVTLRGTLLDPRVDLAVPDAYFFLGLHYDPRRAPFVVPPVFLGSAPFKKVQRGKQILLQATFSFQAPQVKLPPNFHLRVFFQAVAFAKDRRRNRIVPLFARPAPAVFAARCP